MRPVRLTIQAFGPYPGLEVIDFRDAIGSGLFGIYGQTGSGKSSIFSAMTFALFGEAAKSEQDTTSLRSDYADAGVLTEVEFVFEVGDRQFVVVRRPEQMRPKKHGVGNTRRAHEAFLFDASGLTPDAITEENRGKIIAEKKVSDVKEAISDLLGYGAEQFRQIVLLPQGRFETFLSAKTKERLGILRDLFDVSLFRSLTEDLKAEAAEAVRSIQQDREYCARQLRDEGFESTDALKQRIAAAEVELDTRKKAEAEARTIAEAAQKHFAKAESVELLFKVAEDAAKSLVDVQALETGMKALKERVSKATEAKALRDVEENVSEAKNEVEKAKAELALKQNAAKLAAQKAEESAQRLESEKARAEEVDIHRQKLTDYDRYAETLTRSETQRKAVEQAATAEKQAREKFNEAQQALSDLQANHRNTTEKLKLASQTESKRRDITGHLNVLKASFKASETYEKAKSDATAAQQSYNEQKARCEAAQRSAETARSELEAAEQELTTAQTLHLASALEPGQPCPVCGSTDHPSPATGSPEHAGLDQTFRLAKAARETAVEDLQSASNELARKESLLNTREERLVELDAPVDPSETLREQIQECERAIADLGAETALEAAENEIDRLQQDIEKAEPECSTLRDQYDNSRRAKAIEESKLAEMLSAIPDGYRTVEDVGVALQSTQLALTERNEARNAAETTDRAAREASVAANVALDAAGKALTGRQERLGIATDIFQSRLAAAKLFIEEYTDLKPAMETLEEDREKVTQYRQKLESAKDSAAAAAKKVEGINRPDLVALDLALREANANLNKEVEMRVRDEERTRKLVDLRACLTAEMQRLDEAEAQSGPLRGLAALVNGANAQKLDLETYAIGAMFDLVLDAANRRLGPMSANQYRLERDLEGSGQGRRGLGIQVFDTFTGRARPTSTLSGGETFIAALALALGLADVVEGASGKVKLDTIFIDEGFGSLDTENGSGTLDKVLQALNALVSQSRAVGLISHVQLVQEAIPNGFYVRKGPAGSNVEERGVA